MSTWTDLWGGVTDWFTGGDDDDLYGFNENFDSGEATYAENPFWSSGTGAEEGDIFFSWEDTFDDPFIGIDNDLSSFLCRIRRGSQSGGWFLERCFRHGGQSTRGRMGQAP